MHLLSISVLPYAISFLWILNIWSEGKKLILFIIWSLAIKFRLMTSVNWFSPDIAICFQKVIFCCWDNLTYNSYSFLLKGTLLWYCFNINRGVVKHELSIIKHPYPIFRLSCTSEVLLKVVQCAKRALCYNYSPPIPLHYFPYGHQLAIWHCMQYYDNHVNLIISRAEEILVNSSWNTQM